MAWKLDIDPKKLAKGQSAAGMFDTERRDVANYKRGQKKLARETRQAARKLKRHGKITEALGLTEKLINSSNPYASGYTHHDDINAGINAQRIATLNRQRKLEGKSQLGGDAMMQDANQPGVFNPDYLFSPGANRRGIGATPSGAAPAPPGAPGSLFSPQGYSGSSGQVTAATTPTQGAIGAQGAQGVGGVRGGVQGATGLGGARGLGGPSTLAAPFSAIPNADDLAKDIGGPIQQVRGIEGAGAGQDLTNPFQPTQAGANRNISGNIAALAPNTLVAQPQAGAALGDEILDNIAAGSRSKEGLNLPGSLQFPVRNPHNLAEPAYERSPTPGGGDFYNFNMGQPMFNPNIQSGERTNTIADRYGGYGRQDPFIPTQSQVTQNIGNKLMDSSALANPNSRPLGQKGRMLQDPPRSPAINIVEDLMQNFGRKR